jgi:hypothetical protein
VCKMGRVDVVIAEIENAITSIMFIVLLLVVYGL